MDEFASKSHKHTGTDSPRVSGHDLVNAPQPKLDTDVVVLNGAGVSAITFTAPGAWGFTIGDANFGGYGFNTKDEYRTVVAVISNLQARVLELEKELGQLGLIKK